MRKLFFLLGLFGLSFVAVGCFHQPQTTTTTNNTDAVVTNESVEEDEDEEAAEVEAGEGDEEEGEDEEEVEDDEEGTTEIADDEEVDDEEDADEEGDEDEEAGDDEEEEADDEDEEEGEDEAVEEEDEEDEDEAEDDAAEAESTVQEFTLTAKQFEFSPSTITVNEGDTVRLKITSQDVTHGFSIPDFDINETLKAGETVEVEFVADEAGTYSFACSIVCGSGHSGMKGTLVVE